MAVPAMWVRVVKRELAARGRDNIWVTADYPIAPQMRAQMATGAGVMDIDTAARAIWAALPTRESLLLFGEQVRAG